jgi:hypothetical protein
MNIDGQPMISATPSKGGKESMTELQENYGPRTDWGISLCLLNSLPHLLFFFLNILLLFTLPLEDWKVEVKNASLRMQTWISSHKGNTNKKNTKIPPHPC